MRKRMACLFVAAVLMFVMLSIPAYAVGTLPRPNEELYGTDFFSTTPSFSGGYSNYGIVAPPYISWISGSTEAAAGGVPAALRVEAYSGQGGALGYQWYSYNDYGNRTPISGATGSSYTPPCIYGTRGYCVGVYTVVDGMRSDEVMSDTMYVTYTGVEILSAPKRSSYALGEKVDLNGLVVRIYDNTGNYWTSYNGNGLSVYPSEFKANGNVAVEISNGFSSDVFYVAVGAQAQRNAGNHTHEFGDWEITKEATCVTTGVRTRKCECGETESEDILKTEHSWDEGTITKEATANNNGSRLYTCTICKANRSEIIPAGTQSPQPTTSLDAAAAQNPNVIINQGNPANNSGSTYNNTTGNSYSNFNNTTGTTPAGTQVQQGSADGTQNASTAETTTQGGTVTAQQDSGWWLIPVSAVVLVGTGIGAYYLMQKRSRE